MALTAKGSRRIVVDGITYRWRVRKKPTYSQVLVESRLLLAVEHATVSGTTLVVALPQSHPNSWLSNEVAAVLPSDVENYIRAALVAGWQPTKSGKTFRLSATVEA
jgi:hypothetical protein